MNFDLRLPIGIMFSFFGLLLTIYGLVSDKAIYERSLNININLGWGVVLLVFGGWMLFLARHSFCSKCNETSADSKAAAPADKPAVQPTPKA
jgi:hypothetical protein